MASNFDLERIFGKPLTEVDAIISDMDNNIHHLEIPKKDGTKRKIIAPSAPLKWIQKRLNWLILLRYKPSDNAQGFVKNRSIVSNAKVHLNPKSLGHVDIKNFFDTISEKHLSNCLFGNKNICKLCKHYEDMVMGKCSPSIYHNKIGSFSHKCEELKAVFIPDYCEKKHYDSLFKRVIKLCTYKGFAVQGFPTSPYIANIVLRGFDAKMQKVATENNCRYTRYADDLTFSSQVHDKAQLQEIFKNVAYRTLWGFGFEANKKKTFWKDGGRFKVCGIVVNVKPNIMRRAVRLFRAKVHNATVKNAARTTKTYIRQLKGWASYLMSVNSTQGKKYMEKLISYETRKWPVEA